MARPGDATAMPTACLTISHTHAPTEVRERFHFPEHEIDSVLRRLMAEAPIEEAVLLCTCNRTELYFTALREEPREALAERAAGLLSTFADAPPPPPDTFRVLQGEEAVEHLFRVCAGLESQVLGENEILGQMKTAYRLACTAGANGFFTNALFHRAFRVGKRVRTETDLSRGATTIAAMAVEHAAATLGDWSDVRVLVVGAGDIAGRVAAALQARGPAALHVSSRRRERACALAERHAAGTIPLEDLPGALGNHDLVFSATASPDHVITRCALHSDPAGPLLLYDLALPRDIDPQLGEVPNVTLHTADDLSPQLAKNMAVRESEIPKAEAMVEAAVQGYARWLQELAAVPSIRRLYEISQHVRQTQVERFAKRNPSMDQDTCARLARKVVQHLMHDIVNELKRTARRAARTHETQDYWRLPDC